MFKKKGLVSSRVYAYTGICEHVGVHTDICMCLHVEIRQQPWTYFPQGLSPLFETKPLTGLRFAK